MGLDLVCGQFLVVVASRGAIAESRPPWSGTSDCRVTFARVAQVEQLNEVEGV